MKTCTSTILFLLTCFSVCFCTKKKDTNTTAPPANLAIQSWSIDGVGALNNYTKVSLSPIIQLNFSAPLDRKLVGTAVKIKDNGGTTIEATITYKHNDSTVLLQPAASLKGLSKYSVSVSSDLKSAQGGNFLGSKEITFITAIDSSDKFPRIPDEELLTLVQRQTFKYFWDFGHPVSGLARERNSSGDIVTSGGSGFGVMAILVGMHRQFISRMEGLARVQKMVSFLKNTAVTVHGAYPHWLNGATGAIVPFSAKDDGADLVETSYLLQGLLTARQYFSGSDAAETALREDINFLWNRVEWNWFRKNNEDVLYWHYSPKYNWDMNMPVKGWNEALITYVLAASSTTYSIPKEVYDKGWAGNGAIKNGNRFYGYQLPLGPDLGGPLFFAHYSFLGINPNGLADIYANYWEQNKNHSLINYSYCADNPKNFYGYSSSCWGLTASDIPNGYTASSPTNDVGVIAPTAALSSFPYTPQESMQALKFFYYTLGDKLWKEYGFVDAFSLQQPWFANSFLAIDQGPIIIMIENYRSGLLWDLFMSCPEIKTGMKKLGFTSPNL